MDSVAARGTDSFFRRPPTGLADGFGREDRPTANADAPQDVQWFPGSLPIRRAGRADRRLLKIVTVRDKHKVTSDVT
ncbi:hypothetical protein GCM10010399_04190 [Dactylosporangium fulvum]